jgi:hypothetical protein
VHGGYAHHHPDRDAVTVGTVIFATYVVVNAIAEKDRQEDAQVRTAPVADCEEFDRASAWKTLAAAKYKDCGYGGTGHVIVTFDSDGSVSSARLEDGDFSEETEACVIARFEKSVRVAPYCGGYHRVRWQITLPESM